MIKLPSLKDTIQQHGLSSKKALGQHFLLDTNITDRIVRHVDDLSSSTIIEVGPGPGGLTRSLLYAHAKKVIAIEYDARAIPILEELQQHFPDRLSFYHTDATKMQWRALFASLESDNIRIVSNLPYNKGTELVLQWLEADTLPFLKQIVVMLQKEVVDRLIATPGNKTYGRLSILSQWLCTAERCFTLPPGAFWPPPAVDSAVISLVPRETPLPVTNRALLEQLTQQLFSMRRKTLRNGLQRLTSNIPMLETLRIDLNRRPETLTIEEFVLLANQLAVEEK